MSHGARTITAINTKALEAVLRVVSAQYGVYRLDLVRPAATRAEPRRIITSYLSWPRAIAAVLLTEEFAQPVPAVAEHMAMSRADIEHFRLCVGYERKMNDPFASLYTSLAAAARQIAKGELIG